MCDKDQACKEANWFAMAFLMPSEEFTQKFHQFQGDLWLLSDYFRVTRHHAMLRVKSLKLEKK